MNARIPMIVFAVSLLFTVAMWAYFSQLTATRQQRQFDAECDALHERLDARFSEVTTLLGSLQRMFAGYVEVVPDVFQLSVAIPGSTTPGVRVLGFSPRLRYDDLPGYITYARQVISPRFYIVPEGKRDMYHPLEFIAPQEAQPSLLGFDVSSDSAVQAVVGGMTPAGPVCATRQLRLGPLEDSVVVFLVPVSFRVDSAGRASRGGIDGLCLALVNVDALVRAALTFSYDSTRIAFSILDSDGSVLFRSTSDGGDATSVRKLRVADREWSIHFARQRAFLIGSDSSEVHLTMLIGLLFSVLLSTTVWLLLRRSVVPAAGATFHQQ